MLEVLVTMLKEYMRVAERMSEQAYFMDRILRTEGKSRFITWNGGVMPTDPNSNCVVVAEPDAYSIMAKTDKGSVCLVQCVIEDSVSNVVGGKFADLVK